MTIDVHELLKDLVVGMLVVLTLVGLFIRYASNAGKEE